MTYLPAEKVKPDNSNLFRHSNTLWKALRKERFSKIKLDAYYRYLLVSSSGCYDPYPDADLAMDVERFNQTLDEGSAEVLLYFMRGLSVKEIAAETGRSLPNTYFKLRTLLRQFTTFYLEVHDE